MYFRSVVLLAVAAFSAAAAPVRCEIQVTTFDCDDVQAAIDAAGASRTGDTVHLPAGMYECTAPLRIPFSQVYVRGDGTGATRIEWSGAPLGGPRIVLGGTSTPHVDLGLRDLTLGNAAFPTDSEPMVLFDNTSRGSLVNVHVDDATVGVQIGTTAEGDTRRTTTTRLERTRVDASVVGLNAVSFASLRISDSHLAGRGTVCSCPSPPCFGQGDPTPGSVGISVGGGPVGFDNVWIDQTVVEEFDTGIRLAPTTGSVANIRVSDSAIDRFDTAAILVFPRSGGRINQVTLSDNHLSGGRLLCDGTTWAGKGAGIVLVAPDAPGIQRVEVTGNMATDLGRRFAQIAGNVTSVNITGNHSINGGLERAYLYAGIEVAGLNGVYPSQFGITNNVIAGLNHDWGIRVTGPSTNFVITGNELTGVAVACGISVNTTPHASRVWTNNTRQASGCP